MEKPKYIDTIPSTATIPTLELTNRFKGSDNKSLSANKKAPPEGFVYLCYFNSRNYTQVW